MNNPLYRPPAEAFSTILQIDQGCPYNRCTFCRMYRDVAYQKGDLASIEALIVAEARRDPRAKRIFLADGDVMRRPFSELLAILKLLIAHFPRLARVNLYANGSSILAKTDDELRVLKDHKLQTLYMGMESGDDEVLNACNKGETASAMVEAGLRAQSVGLRMSVMLLLGLGGMARSSEHAAKSAAAMNRMQPRLLSTLRVIPVPGTPLFDDVRAGRFQEVSEFGAVEELRNLLEGMELESTVFRANHTSNIVPLEGRLPRDKDRLIAELNGLLASGQLDKTSPGPAPLSL